MRLHMRRAHTTEYNRADETEAEKPKRSKLWTHREVEQMAREEIAYTGSNIVAHLMTCLGRTKDSIKMKMRSAVYIEKLR